MSIPNNLKNSIKKKEVNSFSDLNLDPDDEDLELLINEAALEYLGYEHSSNVLDVPRDLEFKTFLGWKSKAKKPKPIVNDDSSMESYYPSDSLDRHIHYQEVKDKFQEKMAGILGHQSLNKLSTFENFYKKAQKKGFKGSTQELEQILKNSSEFIEIAKNITTAARN